MTFTGGGEGGGVGDGDGVVGTYFGWPDTSLLACLQIRYEQMACLHSVKQFINHKFRYFT